MEKNEILEGKTKKVEEIDDLDDTSASEQVEAESEDKPIENISNFPSPTEEQQVDAGMPLSESVKSDDKSIIPSEENVSADDETKMFDEFISDTADENQPVEENVDENSGAMHEELGVVEAPIKTFTQSQVDEIAGKTRLETREKTFRYIYDRYGVNSEEELDDLIGNAQRYDSLKEQFDSERADWKQSSSDREHELADVKEKVALLESGIDKDRYEDAKFILKGKGLDVTLENIQSELTTHPEWRKVEGEKANPDFVKTGEGSLKDMPSEPVSKISVLGNERISPEVNDEEDYAMKKLFKVSD